MSFWTGKTESLLQSLVEITFKSVISGIVVVLLAQVLISMVDDRIEVASKRDALNTFRNAQLTKLTTRLSGAFLGAGCLRSERSAGTEGCRAEISALVTELDGIFWELRAHFPGQSFRKVTALATQANALYTAGGAVTQDRLDRFAAGFGEALDEMAQNFR